MLKEDLRVWKKEVFGYNERLRLTLVNKLQVLDQMDDDNNLDENLIKEHKQILSQLHVISMRNESLLLQKFRVQWFKQGDSKYFHAMIKQRRIRNEINGVKHHGVWEEEPNAVKVETHSFYSNRMASAED